MITASNFFLAIAIFSALGGVVPAMMIIGILHKRGVKINWLWLRWLIIYIHLDQYRDITRDENGRTGPLYYAFLIAMNMALVFAIIGLVLRAL